MEELLNELIKKGWQPFGGPYYDKFIIESDGDMCFRWKYPGTDGTHSYDYNFDYFKIRELVSKESGLWQFVCENRMTKEMEKIPRGIWINSWHKSAYEKCPIYTMEEAEYRIIESALCNEDSLEKFLLDNIKI